MEPESGVVSWRSLLAEGRTQSDVRRAIRSGDLHRIRRGWYACASADPDVAAAVAAGGVLSCVSALGAHGVWVPEGSRIHVRSRRRGPRFCRQYGTDQDPESAAVDSIPTALRHAVRCLDPEGLIIVCDSLVNLGLLARDEITLTLGAAPPRILRALDRCDRSESGTETIVRLRLRRRGIRVTPQVFIPGLGRVDLLVGRRLILEIDGRQYHSSSAQFESDRERDRRAIHMGYLVVRLSYRQVMYDWESAETTIVDLVRRREHQKVMPTAWPR